MTKHGMLARAQAKIAGVALAILLALTGGSAISQAVQHSNHETAVEHVTERGHFYKVIAGQESPDAATVDNTLAKELRNRLGPVDTSATRLPVAVENFKGNSNTYGGITDAIQMDPFDETGLSCFECGPLSPMFKAKLLAIKQGRVDDVIRQELPPAEATPGYSLTPAGISGFQYALLLWAAGGPLTLALAHLRLKGRPGYVRRFRELTWRLDSGVELPLILASGAYFVPYLTMRVLNRRKLERAMRERYAEPMRWVDEVDHMLALIPPGELDNTDVRVLERTRDNLLNQIETLTRNKGLGFGDQIHEMNARLDDVKYWLQIRNDMMGDTVDDHSLGAGSRPAEPESKPGSDRREVEG